MWVGLEFYALGYGSVAGSNEYGNTCWYLCAGNVLTNFGNKSWWKDFGTRRISLLVTLLIPVRKIRKFWIYFV